MARSFSIKKGIIVTEDMDNEQLAEAVDDWILVEILDGGCGNRPFRCECGMSFRYQYIVTHNKQNKTYKTRGNVFRKLYPFNTRNYSGY